MHVDVPPGPDPKPYYASAFGIGIVAASVMLGLLWAARLAGWTQFNLGMTLGLASSYYTLGESPGAWVQGMMAVLVCGGLFALVYAWVFEVWSHHTARAWLGALLGAAHSIVGGALMAWLIPAINPGVAGDPLLAHPGFMGVGYGMATVAVFIAVHIAYGAVIGGWMHAAPLATRYLSEVAAKHPSLARVRPA